MANETTRLAKFGEPCWAHKARGGYWTGWAGKVRLSGLYGQERGIALTEEAAVADDCFTSPPRDQVYAGFPPMKILPITITGFDTLTPMDMAGLLPVEWGFLWSVRRAGKEPRYMPIDQLNHAAKYIPRCALHVCGKEGRQLAIEGTLPHDLDLFQRIQVNGPLTDLETVQICDNYPNHVIITQLGDRGTTGNLQLGRANHAVLVDASGGNGISPAEWRKPPTLEPVGYAGGLGPHNLLEELAKIGPLLDKGWWIDMEGKVRNDDDWLDFDKVISVVRKFETFAAGTALPR